MTASSLRGFIANGATEPGEFGAEPSVPEKDLWTAVLIEAMCDYHSKSQWVRRSARQFFEVREDGGPTCCEIVCEAIFVRHDEIAAGLPRPVRRLTTREIKRLRKMRPGLAGDDPE